MVDILKDDWDKKMIYGDVYIWMYYVIYFGGSFLLLKGGKFFVLIGLKDFVKVGKGVGGIIKKGG